MFDDCMPLRLQPKVEMKDNFISEVLTKVASSAPRPHIAYLACTHSILLIKLNPESMDEAFSMAERGICMKAVEHSSNQDIWAVLKMAATPRLLSFATFA